MPYLHLNSWAGHTVHPVKIVKESDLTCTVELLEDCLKGPEGAVLRVPWYAISDEPPNTASSPTAPCASAGDDLGDSRRGGLCPDC